MTFKKFESLFKEKYPNGTVYPHDVYEHGVPGRVQKVAVEFAPGGKVYKYAGAYEDILCRMGINVISKERFAEIESNLNHMQELHGSADEFFGGVFDCSASIATLTAEIEKYRSEYIIV